MDQCLFAVPSTPQLDAVAAADHDQPVPPPYMHARAQVIIWNIF